MTLGERKQKGALMRIIAPVLPHPASFTNFVPGKESDLTKSSSIVLNFVPHSKFSSAKEAKELTLICPGSADMGSHSWALPRSNSNLFMMLGTCSIFRLYVIVCHRDVTVTRVHCCITYLF